MSPFAIKIKDTVMALQFQTLKGPSNIDMMPPGQRPSIIRENAYQQKEAIVSGLQEIEDKINLHTESEDI